MAVMIHSPHMPSVSASPVAGVRASARLADSAACLVRDEHDLGPQLRRVLEVNVTGLAATLNGGSDYSVNQVRVGVGIRF